MGKQGIEINVKVSFEYESIVNLFVTAMEGGSDYWYGLSSQQRERIKNMAPDKNVAETFWDAVCASEDGVPVRDAETGDILGRVTRMKVKAALQKMGDEYGTNLNNILDGSYDAEDADIFFQLCVMGEITFG